MSQNIAQTIAEWKSMNGPALRRIWKDRWGEDAPTVRREELFKRMAYRIQEEAFGGLSDKCREQIQVANHSQREGNSTQAKRQQGLMPGSRIERKYKGVIYQVNVLEEGFLYQGGHYRTLTSVAKAITGQARNGPAFFGMR